MKVKQLTKMDKYRAIFRSEQEYGRKDPCVKRYKRRNDPFPSQITTDLKFACIVR